MAKEKLDKFTTLINAFKVASDELSKLNLDTNDNGVEIKKDDENADKAELTSGQKSLVWEAKEDLINAIADHFMTTPDKVEFDNDDTVLVDYETHLITTNEKEAKEKASKVIKNDLENYIWDIESANLNIKDFLEMFVNWVDGLPEFDINSLTDYLLGLNEDLIYKINDNGATYYVI